MKRWMDRLSSPYDRVVMPWAAWVAASTLAALLAVGVVQLLLFQPGSQPEFITGFGLYTLLAVLIGLGQGLVLRKRALGIAQWAMVTLSSWAATVLAVVVINLTLPDAFIAGITQAGSLAIFGPVTGLMQWLFLRRFFSSAWLWILATTVGWFALGLLAGESYPSIWDTAFVGLVPPLFTGAALFYLWPRRPVPVKRDY
jgi:hypothetical protein